MLKSLFETLSQCIPILLTLVLTASSYWLALQAENKLFEQNSELQASSPDYYFTHFKGEQTRPGVLESFKLSGELAQHFPASETLIIQNPVAKQIIQPNITTEISAQQGTYLLNTEQLILSNQVQVKRNNSHDITTIETETLHLDSINSLIWGDTKVHVKQPGRNYSSQGFQYNTKSGEFKATRQVVFDIEPNS